MTPIDLTTLDDKTLEAELQRRQKLKTAQAAQTELDKAYATFKKRAHCPTLGGCVLGDRPYQNRDLLKVSINHTHISDTRNHVASYSLSVSADFHEALRKALRSSPGVESYGRRWADTLEHMLRTISRAYLEGLMADPAFRACLCACSIDSQIENKTDPRILADMFDAGVALLAEEFSREELEKASKLKLNMDWGPDHSQQAIKNYKRMLTEAKKQAKPSGKPDPQLPTELILKATQPGTDWKSLLTALVEAREFQASVEPIV